MSSEFYTIDNLLNSLVRPSNSRPILGSNIRVNSTSNYWSNPMYSRGSSWTSTSDTDESKSVLTPIGSPLKYSPHIWSQSVHTFNRNSIQSLSGNVFIDENSNDSKYEFETNGIDVPLDSNTFNHFKKSAPQSTPVPQYQLFNGFSYAKIKSGVGDKELANRYKNKRRVKTQTFCSFCKNNNETPDVFNSHVVRDPYGRTTCPVLRGYNCPKCMSGGGDNGHTIRYCPLNKPGVEDYIPSVIKQLKNSRSADGKKRGTV